MKNNNSPIFEHRTGKEMEFRRKSKAVLAFVPVMIVLVVLCGCNPRDLPGIREGLKKIDEQATQEANKAIANNPDLKRLDDLCNSIPKNEQYQLYGKRLGNRMPTTVFHFYQSDEQFDVAERRILAYFAAQEWHVRDIGSMSTVKEFTNDKYRVTVQFGGMGNNANYGFSCEERER